MRECLSFSPLTSSPSFLVTVSIVAVPGLRAHAMRPYENDGWQPSPHGGGPPPLRALLFVSRGSIYMRCL